MAFCAEIALIKRKKQQYIEWAQNKSYLFRGSLISDATANTAYGKFLDKIASLIRIWCISDGQRYGGAAQGFSLCDRPYAENGAASRRQAGWSISCPHGRFFQMVGERSQTGAKKYFEGLLEVTGSPFPLYMNVTLSASHSVTFSNSAG